MEINFKPIGVVHSCFKEKFGIPRQPGLAPAATATIELLPPYDREEALSGLDQFSHIWVLFLFHGCQRDEWKPTVRPPRLGGNQRVGVYASRSMFRPNPIGMSAVKLERIEQLTGRRLLHISSMDLLDQTPVLDIKPYIPYSDCISDAQAGYAPEPPSASMQIVFSEQAMSQCAELSDQFPAIRELIEQLLGQDPRPAYYAAGNQRNEFGMKLYDVDVKWQVDDKLVTVLSVDRQ